MPIKMPNYASLNLGKQPSPDTTEADNTKGKDKTISKGFDITLIDKTIVLPKKKTPVCRPKTVTVPTSGLVGQREIFQSFLPKITINKVTLEIASPVAGLDRNTKELYYDKNPHIDIAASPSLSKAEFKQSRTSGHGGDKLKAIVNFEIKQPTTNFSFSFLENSAVREALYIKIFFIKNNFDIYNALSKDGVNYKSEWDAYTTTENKSWSALVEPNSKTKFEKIQEDDTTITIYPFEHTFEIDDVNPKTLGVVVFSYFDVDALKQGLGINSAKSSSKLAKAIWVRNPFASEFVPGGMAKTPIFNNPINGQLLTIPVDIEGQQLTKVSVQPIESQSPKNSLLIIEDKKVVSTAYKFLTQTGAQWEGPAHQMVSGQWMTGVEHSDQQHNLIRTMTATPKVQDFRTSKVVENIQLDFSITDNDIFPNLEKGLYRQCGRIDINKTKSQFSDIFLSRDEKNQCRFFFSIDWARILTEGSIFGKLFKEDDDVIDLLRKGKIMSMRIYRVRLKGSAEAGSDPASSESGYFEPSIKPGMFDENEIPELLFTTKDMQGGTIDTIDNDVEIHGSSRKNALREFTELAITVSNSRKIRHFSGVDGNIDGITDGYYQYKVELEILDSSVELIKKKLDDLLVYTKDLKYYYNQATSLEVQGELPPSPNYSPYVDFSGEKNFQPGDVKYGNYNSKTKSFSEDFIAEWTQPVKNRKQPVGSPKDSLVDAVSYFVSTLKFFSSNWDDGLEYEILQSLLDYVNPIVGTPESINVVINLMETVSNKIESIVDVVKQKPNSFSIENPKTQTKSKPTGKIRTFLAEQTFSSIFNANLPNRLGFDFLGLRTKNTSLGLTQITREDFNRVVVEENAKIWNTDVNHLNPPGTTGQGWWSGVGSINNLPNIYLTPKILYLPYMKTSEDINQLENTLTHKVAPEEYLKPLSYSLYGTKTNSETLTMHNPYQISLAPENQNILANDLALYFSAYHGLAVETLENQNVDSTTPTTSEDPTTTLNSFGVNFFQPTQVNSYKQIYLAYEILFNFLKQTEFDPKIKNLILGPSRFYNLDMYNLADDQSEIRKIGAKMQAPDIMRTIADAPPQIKSLLYYNSNDEKINDETRTAFDNLSYPANYCAFVYKTQVLNKIETLTGYETSGSSVFLNKPIWKSVNATKNNLLNQTNTFLVCRSSPYTNETLMITRNKNFELPTYDEYFMIGEGI